MTVRKKIKTEKLQLPLGSKPERPLSIYFIRHGQAVEVSEDPRGLDDPVLSPMGERQAMRVARRLQMERFDHAYCSPLQRAQLTMKTIIEFHKGLPLTETRDIMEVGRDHFVKVPQGFHPSSPQVIERERDAMMRFANRLRHSHEPGQRLLVVAHGNLIRSLMPLLGGRNPLESILLEIHNASLSVLDVWSSGQAVLKLGNCVKHLLTGEITS